MFCGIHLLRLLNRAMVEPKNDVAVVAICVVELGTCDTLRLSSLLVEDGQGAGGIEANTAYGLWVDVVLVHGTLDRVADAFPDVGYGLFLQNGVNMCFDAEELPQHT